MPMPLMIADFSKWVTDCTLAGMPPRIVPERHEHNRAFWAGGADGELLIARCARCSLWVHPPAADCPDCGGDLTAQPVSGRGEVFSFTVNVHPFNPMVPPPYVIAIVALEEQADLRLAANIVDCEADSVSIGMPVEVRFERHELEPDVAYVPVFVPVSAPRTAQSTR
jgi:uncharacterized OB-fold protein